MPGLSGAAGKWPAPARLLHFVAGRYEVCDTGAKAMRLQAPVIVGAGPAGIRAAQVLVQAGLRPVVVDEAAKPGGQIYRQQPDGFTRTARQLYGFEHRKASALHETARRMIASGQIDYRPNTLVWDADVRQRKNTCNGRHDSKPYERVILVTGAAHRASPFVGCTLRA